MAEKGEQNVPNVKNDFNKAAKNEQTQKAETAQAKAPITYDAINKLNEQRPKKEFRHELTPKGTVTKQVNEAEFNAKNAEIDKKQDEFRARMQAQKGKAKEAFERAASKDKERTR